MDDLNFVCVKSKSQIYEKLSNTVPTYSKETEDLVKRNLSGKKNPIKCDLCGEYMNGELGLKIHKIKIGHEMTSMELVDCCWPLENYRMRVIVEKSKCFKNKLNFELLSKYLPKFDQLSDNFPLITPYIRIFQQSLNLMDLKQIEMDLSSKLEASQAAGYLDCTAEACAGAQPRPVIAKIGFAVLNGAFFSASAQL
ncbi:hypothetical protein BpHYR1_027537 [Brachionus plicatilis]|uniref:C2H2-type domain-containing protein n=1 Tax=Brachionus plicatilis TaxID=10195 RepID=A0A3M7SNV1_BRAPC|nr:hypothetical protein BpHYR1_027537 [Brachionus plicatilis]